MEMRHKRERLKLLTSCWAMVDGRRMHYRLAGKGRQAMVLVHGLTVSGNYLLPTAAELLDDFVVYVPDLPGFGHSENPSHVLDIPEMADTLRSWMDAVGLERAYFLGNSLGCHIVAALADRQPERVSGVILVSPVGDPGGHNTMRLVARALNDFVREPRSLWLVMFRDFLKVGVRRSLLTLHHLQRSRLEEWLPRVDVPALVVGGRRDRIVPRWWIDRVTRLLPQARGAIITDAGHVPNFSHPARLAALMRAFVARDDRTGP